MGIIELAMYNFIEVLTWLKAGIFLIVCWKLGCCIGGMCIPEFVPLNKALSNKLFSNKLVAVKALGNVWLLILLAKPLEEDGPSTEDSAAAVPPFVNADVAEYVPEVGFVRPPILTPVDDDTPRALVYPLAPVSDVGSLPVDISERFGR